MKKLLLILFIISALLAAFTSCGNWDDDRGDVVDDTDGQQNGNDPDTAPSCDHTYADSWSSSSSEHWHAATCEHTTQKSGVANHSDTNEDGSCDVCGYSVGHDHTYSDTWSLDSTHHWRLAVCSHTGVKGELGEHFDAESDGSCDSCGTHMHVLNLNGKCTVCGEQVGESYTSELEDILYLVSDNAGRIVSGNIRYSNVCTFVDVISGRDNVVYKRSVSEKNVDYVFGERAAYYKTVTTASNDNNDTVSSVSDTQEDWYELTDNGSVFHVYRVTVGSAVGDISFSDASTNNMIGWLYSVSTLESAYGAENILYELYALSQSDSASDFAYTITDGDCAFSFGYLVVNNDTGADEPRVDYYEVRVSFSVSSGGALTALNIACDCYANSFYNESDADETDLNNDYTYDKATNTIMMKPTAIPDTYTFTVTQTEGARVYEAEYRRSDFVPNDFTVYTDDALTAEAGGTVTASVGNTLKLYLGGFPEGTSISYVPDTFKVSCDAPRSSCFSNPITASITLYFNTAGTYTLTVTAGDATKTLTIAVTPKQTIDSGASTVTATALTVNPADKLGTDEDVLVNTASGTAASYYYVAETAGTLTLVAEQGEDSSASFTYSVGSSEAAALTVFATETLRLAAGDRAVISVTVTGTATLTAYWSADGDTDA